MGVLEQHSCNGGAEHAVTQEMCIAKAKKQGASFSGWINTHLPPGDFDFAFAFDLLVFGIHSFKRERSSSSSSSSRVAQHDMNARTAICGWVHSTEALRPILFLSISRLKLAHLLPLNNTIVWFMMLCLMAGGWMAGE